MKRHENKHTLVGSRIKVIKLIDVYDEEPEQMGTITFVDDIGQYHVDLDDGRRICVISEYDEYEIL